MAIEINATKVSAQFDKSSRETTINVEFIYTGGAGGAATALDALNAVSEKPPGLDGPNGQFNLKTCSANQNANSKGTYTINATYSDLAPNRNDSDKSSSGGNGGGGGKGRGDCSPKDTETTQSVRAMKDYPIVNHCGTPITPAPQIEVHMIQRTVTKWEIISPGLEDFQRGQEQNGLQAGLGKIDLDETKKQNKNRGIDLRGMGEGGACEKEEGAPAIGETVQEREDNAPCGSLLTGGSVGESQKFPCGNFFPVTKTFVDGNFRAPGIVEVDYKKCPQSSGADMHSGTLDGQRFPIVALQKVGGVIAWPGQPKPKK